MKLVAREPIEPEEAMDEFGWFGMPGEALREARRTIVDVGPVAKRRIELRGDGLHELREELTQLRRELDSLRQRLDKKN